jgi:hypothetical protein
MAVASKRVPVVKSLILIIICVEILSATKIYRMGLRDLRHRLYLHLVEPVILLILLFSISTMKTTTLDNGTMSGPMLAVILTLTEAESSTSTMRVRDLNLQCLVNE